MATYVPNASDATQPTGDKKVSTAAPEFRQAKAKLNQAILFPETGIPQYIPPLATRAGKYLIADVDGSIGVSAGTGGGDAALRTDLAAGSGSTLVGFQRSYLSGAIRSVYAKSADYVNVKDFGAVWDGGSHPLSSITSFGGVSTIGWTLVQWQFIYPHALALIDEVDWCAIQAGIAYLNPNVWNASFNYQQGGGTLDLPKGIGRINRPIRPAPFTRIRGHGPDGWTGGGAGIGLTGAGSPPNGSAIFADFGGTTETCAIDTQNWSVAGGTLYASTNMTPITVGQLGGTYTYCQGIEISNLAIFCTNQTRFGIRLQGAALSCLQNVSVIGFKVGVFSNCVWSTEYTKLFVLAYQVGIAQVTNNAVRVTGVFDLMGWGSSNGTVITNNNAVTVGNKPSFWSANDTNYNGTSIYTIGCFGLTYGIVTAQHCGRAFWHEATDFTYEDLYIEDLPFLSSGSTPGAFNAYNAAAGNTSGVIQHLHSDSNGVTLFNNFANTPVTLLNFSGIQGNTFGGNVTGTTVLLLGNNVNRNAAFGDFAFDPRIISLFPASGTWTPGTTNIGGTIGSVAGTWTRQGNIYRGNVVITGTALTATGGGASVLTTPFNGTGGFPAPARACAAAVSTPNLQVASGLMDTNANLYISAITSTTRIVISFEVQGS